MYKKDLELAQRWSRLMALLQQQIGKRPKDLNAVLFLIGVQELGTGATTFSKEEKQDLMHIAICKVLSYSGYYVLDGVDADGWPHWRLIKKLPRFDLLEQEQLLKWGVLDYFEKEMDWHVPAGAPKENEG
jgi:hypothetical protein